MQLPHLVADSLGDFDSTDIVSVSPETGHDNYRSDIRLLSACLVAYLGATA